MSIPDNTAATSTVETDNEQQEVTTDENGEELPQDPVVALEGKVNSVVNDLIKAEKETGKFELPDDLSVEMKVAVMAEKRRRDTQSSYTKEVKTKKALEAENKALKNKVSEYIKVELTPEQTEELDELKFSDPEAWRKRMNTIEQKVKLEHSQALDTELATVTAEVLADEEKQRRADVLVEFNKANPGFQLDDDIISENIPPRITKKLETGAITFEAFLQECYDYLKTGKVVAKTTVDKTLNMSHIPGGSTPDKTAAQKDWITSYDSEIF